MTAGSAATTPATSTHRLDPPTPLSAKLNLGQGDRAYAVAASGSRLSPSRTQAMANAMAFSDALKVLSAASPAGPPQRLEAR
jgi:hypothetical protein